MLMQMGPFCKDWAAIGVPSPWHICTCCLAYALQRVQLHLHWL